MTAEIVAQKARIDSLAFTHRYMGSWADGIALGANGKGRRGCTYIYVTRLFVIGVLRSVGFLVSSFPSCFSPSYLMRRFLAVNYKMYIALSLPAPTRFSRFREWKYFAL